MTGPPTNRAAERAHDRRDARLAWWEALLLGMAVGLLLGVWLMSR